MTKNAVHLDREDNVIIALEPIKAGAEAVFDADEKIAVLSDIPFAHKLAAKDIRRGEEIIKYGESIGHATQDIKQGEWVHVQNIDSVPEDEEQ